MTNFFNKIWAWIARTYQSLQVWMYSKYFDFIAFLKRLYDWSKHYFRKHYLADGRSLWWVCVIVLAYLLSSGWLWKKFDALVVAKVLADLEFTSLNSLGLCLYIVILIVPSVYGLLKIVNNSYKASMVNLFLLFFLLYLYAVHRNNYNQFDLYQRDIHLWLTVHQMMLPVGYPKVFSGKIIGFFDPIFGVACVYALTLFANVFRFGIFAKGSSILSQDIPITDIASDRFDRSSYFNPLISELRQLAFDSEKAFAVGINSNWGYGKTSLLEIMKRVFKHQEKSTVFMEYNPWMSAMKSGLTVDFFAQLEETLSDHIETDNLIIKYGKALAKVDIDKNPLKKIAGLFESELTLKDRHKQVSDLLGKTNKRFVVVIDDIDRLDNSEVFEVLRLIRNTANFGRVVFVAAYDKNYLTGALGKNQIHEPKKYLEKIFDIELSLPKIGEARLQAILYEMFEKGIDNLVAVATDKARMKGQINNLIYASIRSTDRKYNAVGANIWSILKNKRDVVRFTNAVLLTYRMNQKWVYLPDLVILELIKQIDHNVYLELSVAYNYLRVSSVGPVPVYRLYFGRPAPGPTSAARLAGLAIIQRDVREGKSEELKTLISALFEDSDQTHFRGDKALKIVVNFENYFIYALNSASTASIVHATNI